MSKASTQSFELGRPQSSARMFDKFLLIPILAFAYVQIISPLLLRVYTGPLLGGAWTEAQQQIMIAPRLEQKIFWPAIAAIAVIWAAQNWSRLRFPPHIVSLFALLAFAGLSVLWAFKPEYTFIRSAQQAMVIVSIVVPILLASRTADVLHGVFMCSAFALIVNVFFVQEQSPIILEGNRLCYYGYFDFKGTLGVCAAIGILMSLHEILYRGWRRVLGVIVIAIAVYLIIVSNSKGALGIALIAPILAGITFIIRKKTRLSIALILLPIPVFYSVLSVIVGNLISRISWHLYGNYDLSGRTLIWDFANYEIARRPLLGWGYQSFWLVGPDAPSVLEAPSWVKGMPNAHSGYLDTMVDMGYVGLVLLIILIFTTLHAIGRVIDRDPARGWLVLTLCLYVIITNFIETTWMHGMDMVWLIFVFAAAETGRYWHPAFLRPPVAERHAA